MLKLSGSFLLLPVFIARVGESLIFRLSWMVYFGTRYRSACQNWKCLPDKAFCPSRREYYYLKCYCNTDIWHSDTLHEYLSFAVWMSYSLFLDVNRRWLVVIDRRVHVGLLDPWSWYLLCCPETSVNICQSTPLNILYLSTRKSVFFQLASDWIRKDDSCDRACML